MKLREYHPLSEMERVPAEELPKRLDELFDRMDKENVGFVVTEEGKDSCVFCPYKWFELEYETIEVAVDEVLLAQIKEIITPLGWTVERLIVRFLEWLVDPETQEEAIAWLMKARRNLERNDNERNLREGAPTHPGTAGNQSSVCEST